MFSLNRYGVQKIKTHSSDEVSSNWAAFFKRASVGILAVGFSFSAAAAELVTNGSMANNGTSWIKYAPNTSNPDSKIFTRSGLSLQGTTSTTLMVIDTREAGMSPQSNNVYQKINLQPNARYRIKFLARAEVGIPADMFVRVFQGTDARLPFINTLVTRRVRVADSALTAYSIDFETGDNVSGDYSLSFSGRSYTVVNYTHSFPGNLVGLTDVSLVSSPIDSGGKLINGTYVSVDVNQAGYLGKNKPFVFTMSGLPSTAKINAISLTRIADNGYGMGVSGDTTGRPLFGNVLSDKFDLESGQRVVTMNFDTVSTVGHFPSNLSDDLQLTGGPAVSFGHRLRGYKVSVDVDYQTLPDPHTGSTATRHTTVESRLFPISKNIYSKLVDDALNYFDFNTAGKSVGEYTGNIIDDPARGEQHRAAGHPDNAVVCRSGKDNFGNDFGNGCSLTSLDVHGGWYDAGDQGKYVVNGGIALWTMQNLIERLQNKSDASSDANVKTQLSSQIYNLMKRAKEEMDFMLRMQAPDGTKANVPVGYQGGFATYTDGNVTGPGYYHTVANPQGSTADALKMTEHGSIFYRGGYLPRLAIKLDLTNEDVSGMVFHSVTDDTWTDLPTAPANDKKTRVLSYPTSAATFNMAAVAAQAFRIWSWENLPSDLATVKDPLSATGTSMTAQAYADLCLSKGYLAYSKAKARYESGKGNIYRYEYSHNNWSAQDAPSTDVLGGITWVDNQKYPNAGPNFTWLAVGFSLAQEWTGGGAYGDYRIRDEYYWASMEMFLSSTHKKSTLKFLSTDTAAPKSVSDAYTAFISFVPSSTWGDTEKGHPSSTQKPNGVYSGFVDKGFPVLAYDWSKGFDWQNVAPLGTLSALTASASYSQGAVELQKDTVKIGTLSTSNSPKYNLLTMADLLSGFVGDQAYRFAKFPIKTNVYNSSLSGAQRLNQLQNRDYQYEWGSNGNVLNRAIILAIASDLTADAAKKTTDSTVADSLSMKSKTYADATVLSMDYILGRNANGVSYVSGYGFNSVQNPHHRFWAKILDANFPAVPDGVLFGGPNSRDISAIMANSTFGSGSVGTYESIDTFKSKDNKYFLEKAVQGTGCLNNNFYGGSNEVFAPQKCFIANPHSFASAEVAINWNAPLAWMAQFLNDYAQK